MSIAREKMIVLGLGFIISLVLTACPPVDELDLEPTPSPTPTLEPSPSPSPVPYQLSIQVKIEGVVDAGRASQVAVPVGQEAQIRALAISGNIFCRWEILSGAGASIMDPFAAQTSLSIQADTVLTAVYVNAYYNAFNGHSYKLVNGAQTWVQAQAACAAMGGHLVAIANAEEQSFVNLLLNRPEASGTQYWYGGFQPLTSNEPLGNWQWVSGEPLTWGNWSASQPDNVGGEHYMHSADKTGTWNDNTAVATLGGYICEWGNETSYIQKVKFGGHRYAYSDLQMTWDQAKDYAEKLGGRLAIISSQAENDFVYSLIGPSVGTRNYYWLGARQIGVLENTEGWEWLNGNSLSSTLVFRNWGTAQPDGANTGTNKLMISRSEGTWFDEVGSNLNGILIEWE